MRRNLRFFTSYNVKGKTTLKGDLMKRENERQSVLPDEAIIELYWKREEKAIEATETKYGRYLYSIAYNILYDRLYCEECLNDTYLNTWNSIPPKRPSAFQIFLSKVMRNLALDRFRKNNAEKRVPSELVVSLDELEDCLACSVTDDEEYGVRQVARILNSYLRSLSDRRIFIFVWRYYYADSVAEIARMLGMSETTVRRELTAIREGLRKKLEEEGYRYE